MKRQLAKPAMTRATNVIKKIVCSCSYRICNSAMSPMAEAPGRGCNRSPCGSVGFMLAGSGSSGWSGVGGRTHLDIKVIEDGIDRRIALAILHCFVRERLHRVSAIIHGEVLALESLQLSHGKEIIE